MFENEKVKKIFSWVFSMALTLALAALTAVFLFQSVMMQESSMEPTISVGDKFLINKIVYKIQEPKRGDIIVFKTNASEDAALHIRRVIGVPGDTVQIKEGRIWINGEIYNEGMDLPKMTNAGLAENAISLQSDRNRKHFFGNNCGRSPYRRSHHGYRTSDRREKCWRRRFVYSIRRHCLLCFHPE